uniref:DUF3421 domain-containing protein n=1 Tax=Trichobilharzia regenti TaxID=157069 RepID=A0AA85JP11_TRIRE|nr:unnamed protein product [Trichobilharzia regenti]
MAKVGNGVQIPLSWVHEHGGAFPKNSLKADEGIYVARCRINDDLLVGKFVSTYGKAYCPHEGKELEFTDYELLCDSGIPGCREGYEWIMMNGGDVPENAVVGGIDRYGAPLYVVRGRIQGETCVGKLLQGEGNASFAWGGDEHKIAEYDVLVLKN